MAGGSDRSSRFCQPTVFIARSISSAAGGSTGWPAEPKCHSSISGATVTSKAPSVACEIRTELRTTSSVSGDTSNHSVLSRRLNRLISESGFHVDIRLSTRSSSLCTANSTSCAASPTTVTCHVVPMVSPAKRNRGDSPELLGKQARQMKKADGIMR